MHRAHPHPPQSESSTSSLSVPNRFGSGDLLKTRRTFSEIGGSHCSLGAPHQLGTFGLVSNHACQLGLRCIPGDASCTSRSAAVLDLFNGGCTRMRPKTRPKSRVTVAPAGRSCQWARFRRVSESPRGVGLMAQLVILEGCAAVSLSWIDTSIRG